MTDVMDRVQNIIIVGTGGQGVILASEILSDVAMLSGLDVKKSEVHGMAQRGGVVSSHVRFGRKVWSPLIPKGEADVMLAFEAAEAIRWLDFMSPQGKVIASTQKIVPPIVSMGLAEYPSDPEATIRGNSTNPVLVDALALARELGNPRLVNTILLGITSRMLDLPLENWREVVAERVPAKARDLNLIAFDKGRNLA